SSAAMVTAFFCACPNLAFGPVIGLTMPIRTSSAAPARYTAASTTISETRAETNGRFRMGAPPLPPRSARRRPQRLLHGVDDLASPHPVPLPLRGRGDRNGSLSLGEGEGRGEGFEEA